MAFCNFLLAMDIFWFDYLIACINFLKAIYLYLFCIRNGEVNKCIIKGCSLQDFLFLKLPRPKLLPAITYFYSLLYLFSLFTFLLLILLYTIPACLAWISLIISFYLSLFDCYLIRIIKQILLLNSFTTFC